MLINKDIAQITAEVESGELTKEKLLEGIASAQYGEDMRKYIYAILSFWIGGGTFKHDELENRDKTGQHPIEAISQLTLSSYSLITFCNFEYSQKLH